MNIKTIISISTLAGLGLIVGYCFFGSFAGGHVSLSTLFSIGGNAFQNAFQSISGIEAMRNKILLCGLAGAVLGMLVSFKLKK